MTYIQFVPLPPKPKTKVWAVRPRDGSPAIGEVKWHGPWRKYCFFPAADCLFEQVCLREIADFITTETAAHKAQSKIANPKS